MRIGTVCWATESGLGYLAKDFFDAGVITDPVILVHTTRPNRPEWYSPNLDSPKFIARPFAHRHRNEVDRLLAAIDVLLVFETPFDWDFLSLAKDRGVKTVLVPMYEWTPKRLPVQFDKIICPSVEDQKFFPGAPFLPIPVPPSVRWEQRTKVRRFLHNAGHLGFGSRGTLEILQAMKLVKSPVELTVRTQDKQGLAKLIASVPWSQVPADDSRITFDFNPLPREQLYTGFDAFIAPDHYNGLSLPLQEAFASGMLVITTDRCPHNTWLPRASLVPVTGYRKWSYGGSYNEIDWAEFTAEAVAAKIDEWYDRDISDYSLLGSLFAGGRAWNVLRSKWMAEIGG